MAKATAIFDGDDSRLSRVISGIEKKLTRVAMGMAQVGAAGAKMTSAAVAAFAAPAAAVVAVLGGLGVGVKSALDTGGFFSDLSANTGIAVKDLVLLEREFKNAGKSGEDIAGIVGKMQRNLASGDAGAGLSKLGMDMDALRSKSPVDQFHAIGQAINGIQDPAEKTAAAMAVFGKSGNELLAMFATAGFGDAAAQVGMQADLLNKDAALFDDVSDKLALVGTKTKGFFIGVADKIAPVLKPLLDSFAAIDLAKYGQAVGDAIATAVQAFNDGTLVTLISESLIIGAKEFGNALIGVMTSAAFGFGASLVAAAQMLPELLSVVTSLDFWAGMSNSLLAAGNAFIALMLDGVAAILRWLSRAPGLGKLGKAGDAVSGAAGKIHQSAAESREDAAQRFTASPIGDFNERLSESIKAVWATTAEGYKLGASVFDSSNNKELLAASLKKTIDNLQAVQKEALKEVPTWQPPKGGFAKGMDEEGINKGSGFPVTQLARIGGAYGRVSSVESRQEAQLRRHEDLLRQLVKNTDPKGGTKTVRITPEYG